MFRVVIGSLMKLAAVALSGVGAAAQDAWKAEWDRVRAGANKEGKVIVSGPPGAFQRQVITEQWTKAFPGIKLEYTGARGTQIVAKVVRERDGGVFAWDIILAATDPTVASLVPIKALAPLREAILDPSIMEDKTWFGGFERGFLDNGKQYLYGATAVAGTLGFVNRDCVKSEHLSKADDLKSTALKGKIVWFDPTQPGTGAQGMYMLALVHGEEWLRDMFLNHGVVYSRDYKQMTDWLVNCSKPVAIGLLNDVLEQMQEHGIGKNVVEIEGPGFFGNRNPGGVGGNAHIGWYRNAPNPNAAKMFVNWYLSRAFQQAYADVLKANSRRLDVTPRDPAHMLKPGVDYLNTTEATVTQVKALQDRVKSWGVPK